MNVPFFAAGLLSGLVCFIHIFGGGRSVARPLLAAKDLKDVPKYTQYYCWHLVTIVLAGMTVAFVYCALRAKGYELAWFVSMLAAAFTVWGLALPPAIKQQYRQMPQGWFFAPIAVLGIVGAVI